MNTNYQGDGAHLKAVQKDKEKCCFMLPRAPWIKLWYIWLILPLFSLEYGLGMYPQNSIPWLPAYAVLLFMFFYIGVVFFCGTTPMATEWESSGHGSMDTSLSPSGSPW